MRLIRVLVALVVAVVLALLGLAFITHTGPAGDAVVFATDVRGPKVTMDGGLHLERAPQLRILAGRSRKAARWRTVNPLQYASCSVGDRWNGQRCSAAASSGLQLPAGPGTRQVLLLAVGVALAAVPAVTLATNRRPRP